MQRLSKLLNESCPLLLTRGKCSEQLLELVDCGKYVIRPALMTPQQRSLREKLGGRYARRWWLVARGPTAQQREAVTIVRGKSRSRPSRPTDQSPNREDINLVLHG